MRTININATENVLKGKYKSKEKHLVLIDATNGSISFELPDCGSVIDVEFYITRVDTESGNTVTMTGYNSQIDTQTFDCGDFMILLTDSIKWYKF